MADKSEARGGSRLLAQGYRSITKDLEFSIEALQHSSDFSRFRAYADRLRVRLSREMLKEAASRVDPEWRQARDISKVAAVREPLIRKLGPSVVVAIIVLALSAGYWVLDLSGASELSNNWVARVANIGVAVLATVPIVVRIVRRRIEALAIQEEVEWAVGAYRSKVAYVAREVLLEAINRELGPEGVLPFPARGPWLVESSSRPAVPLRTLDYVTRFVNEHESSAVGIAGPRGAGKSTIISEIYRSIAPEHVKVMIPAPVAYDGHDFLKRLAKKLAIAVSGPEGRFQSRRTGYIRSAPARIWLVVLVAGAVLAASSALGFLDLPSAVVPMALGLGAVLVAYLALAIGLVSARRRVFDDSQVSTADQLVQWLDYEVSEERVAKVALNGFDVFALETSGANTSRRREASHESLSGAIASFLTSVATRPGRKVFIFVDELDKLSDASAAVDIVNLLKDLFHIPGVHFVVSVSMEALAAFELRGVQVRDAFDSSFDTIVEVQPMTGAEGLTVLASRVAGFPPLAGAACHGWSGGLPRDLLRLARRMIEINADRTIAPPVLHLFREVLVEDLLTKVGALSRSGAYAGNLQGLTGGLLGVRDRGAVAGPALLDELSTELLSSPFGRRLELGIAWLAFLERSAPQSKTNWIVATDSVLRVADDVANAISRSTAVGGLAEEAHARALTACESNL